MTVEPSPVSPASGFFAHSEGADGTRQTMREHASEVARIAEERAPGFLKTDARLAGWLHDFGKYAEIFDRRLQNDPQVRGLDHWTAGACLLAPPSPKHGAVKSHAAAAVHGHHVGLARWSDGGPIRMNGRMASSTGGRLTFDEGGMARAREALQADGFHPPINKPTRLENTVQSMLDCRFVLSALCGADYTDTARHMHGVQRPAAQIIDAANALATVDRHRASLGKGADPAVIGVRNDLWTAALVASESQELLFEMEAPTGSGKTLAMLGFALRRMVVRPQSRRLITALPFLAIVDKTADDYRQALHGTVPVFEHHTLAEWRKTDNSEGTGRRTPEEMYSEDWETPIVVTTTVQLLESLFSDRPAGVRKLCALANAVIMIDEAQSVPAGLGLPTARALARLATEEYGATVLLATATQPQWSRWGEAWRPTPVVPRGLDLYSRTRRYEEDWSLTDEPQGWEEIAKLVAKERRALCIVNTVRDARRLAELIAAERPSVPVAHLSTRMCAAHRREVLARPEVADRDTPGILVATQCVEAGVDIDYPVVFRALAPLDALAQAAGRCNRAGAGTGRFVVFLPEAARYPGREYERGGRQAKIMFDRGHMDLQDPTVHACYFREMAEKRTVDGTSAAFEQAVAHLDFPEVAKLYRIVERQDVVRVLVPYSGAPEIPDQPHGAWFREAAAYAVDVRRTSVGALGVGRPLFGGDEWFIATEGSYHPTYGFDPYTDAIDFLTGQG